MIVAAMIESLRARGILLTAATVLERIGLAARARKQAHKNLVEGLERRTIAGMEALIAVSDDKDRTPLAWLRDWPEAPTQKNLLGIVERMQFVRGLGVDPDREQRIHRARYRAIAKETSILSVQHLSRFDTLRRLATLVVFAREMEAILTDAALVMFDKMLGGVFRRAYRAYRENVVHRAKALDASTRALLHMAKAMLAAKASGEDQVAAVERSLGWERLKSAASAGDGASQLRGRLAPANLVAGAHASRVDGSIAFHSPDRHQTRWPLPKSAIGHQSVPRLKSLRPPQGTKLIFSPRGQAMASLQIDQGRNRKRGRPHLMAF